MGTKRRLVQTASLRLVGVPVALDSGTVPERMTAQQRLRQSVARHYPYPAERFSGRGVVICAGGMKYFPCVWVCLNMLRRVGCRLPAEIWHLGPEEMPPAMKAILSPLDVEFVDALEVRRTYPVRILNGWEVKPFSIIHSRFQEVLYLDADNVPIVNPEVLFDTPEYRETGAIFFPDFSWLREGDLIWRICGLDGHDEPAFESGQIVIDKARCWKALQVTMHLNEYSDFYYRYMYGDKDTFHMAWRKLRQPYAMPSRGPGILPPCVICQHDFAGRRIFQHRCGPKWTLDGENPAIAWFDCQAECLALIEDLRTKWKAACSG